jgi:acyl-CoA thioesterase I
MPGHVLHRSTLALGMLLLGSSGAEADSVPTIMPLGDSITYGGAPSFSTPVPGGYRTRLYTDLNNGGFIFNFVGTVTENSSPLLSQPGQIHHEGHPGYRIDQIANNLDRSDGSSGNNGGFWFHKPAPPDITLLLIGSNDIIQNFQTSTMAQRLDKLIGQIVADSPASILFVSTILPNKLFDANQNRLTQAYNTQIRDTIVPKYDSLGDNVIFVDQYANFMDANGNIIHIGPDGVHPDQIGYDLMGDTWAAALQPAIPEPASFLLAGLGGVLILLWPRHRTSTTVAGGNKDRPPGSGTPFDVMITALDPSGNVDTNYTGMVTWASSDTDPGVILPTDYTFQANDNGTHTFTAGVTLIASGNQSLTATQTASGITGSAPVTVGPGP